VNLAKIGEFVIDVSDSGVGMTKEQLRKVFKQGT